MPFSHYKGQSIGRHMHFFYHICGLRIAENVVFCGPGGIIRLWGKSFARVLRWEGELQDVPFFEFYGDDAATWTDSQDKLRQNQEEWKRICERGRISFRNQIGGERG